MLVTELLGGLAEREARRDWWRAAACRTADPDIFFPVSVHGPGGDDIARAKAVCADCTVRRQCLQFALATHQMHGVWGGTTEEERRLHMSPVPAQREPAEPSAARRPAAGLAEDESAEGDLADGDLSGEEREPSEAELAAEGRSLRAE